MCISKDFCRRSLCKQVPIAAFKIYLLFLGIVFLSISTSKTYAQEIIRELSVNPELVKISQGKKEVKQLKALAVADSLDLPFVDDFSTTTIYPDQKLWIDKQAYINTTYQINPVTIGVATLDALDENGQLYKNASSSPFSADTLTSRPFKLNFNNEERTDFFFSFFYQPQGSGDNPETRDSLIVEFYSPDSLKWKKVWAAPGDSLREFKQVKPLINVGKEYQKNGFQFRFRNIASIDASDVAGKHGNVDQWNIDYVRLDTSRNDHDSIIEDIAFVKPMTSLLKTYQSMPWSHYKIAFRTENKPTIDITYRNNGTEDPTIGRNFKITEIRDDNKGSVIIPSNPANADIKPGETITLQADLFSPFNPIYSSNLVKFDVESFLSNTHDKRRENDTIHYTQIFSNYFAYDDGTSEAGYGLGSQNAMAAYSFIAYQPDTLTGISFYFNPTEHDTTTTVDYAFDLAVWDDYNGMPGNLIYSRLITPQKVSLNQFYNFKLDSGILINGTFYVGFKQESENFLNIGFDRNNNNQRFLFINYNGVWATSTIAGSIMIRPVLGGNTQEGPVSVKKITTTRAFSLYPNPADNQIYINIENYSSSKPLSVEIYNITGKLVLSSKLHENILDVSNLTNGLYLLKLSGENVNFQPIKLLIQR